jgi:YgiT-type zinc finger domain-containing protein
LRRNAALREKRVSLHFKHGATYVIVEGVPAGVCRNCGQRVFKGLVLEQVEQLVARGGARKTAVRVARFAAAAP